MLSIARTVRSPALRSLNRARTVATQADSRRAGDISDAFASLSGQQFAPLSAEYADLKARLIKGNEEAIRQSWERLLNDLREEIPLIAEKGSKIIPDIDFKDIDNAPEDFSSELKKRGVAVVRGVVSEQEALDWKESLREYIKANPQTKAFPPENPQVFELYWSRAQILARGHPNMLKTQRFLMSHWYAKNPHTPISTRHPISYADRLRMRLPGDSRFALGPHVDGGSVERWDENGYGLGRVYDSIWKGRWEDFDPWESSCRLFAVTDLHNGVGASTAFRMFQGWLSMSTTAPGEGTLLVNPLLAKATAYYLLRPFFSPTTGAHPSTQAPLHPPSQAFLTPSNWSLDSPQSSWLHGATPARGQELDPSLHPHLHLPSSMVHVPTVRPGDYVAWHCDTIHAVDRTHAGTADSSVLYIPACPLTEDNARYLVRQRAKFVNGEPSPDFGGGEGEGGFEGRVRVEDLGLEGEEGLVGREARRGMGLEEWDGEEEGLGTGERVVVDVANKVLGFYA